MEKKLIFLTCLFFFLVVLASCATTQPTQPPKARVMLHPAEYPNHATVEDISIAAVPFSANRSIYSDPNDANPSNPPFNLLEAGVCPVRLIFSNESSGSIFVDPSQISCIDVNGVTYQPFDVDEAGDLVVASKAFQNWAKGSVSGAVMGSLLGSALGSVLGSIGRQDSTQKGVLLGSVADSATGAAEDAKTSYANIEQQLRQMLAKDNLKEMTIYRNMKRDGVVLLPAVKLQKVQILLQDPDSNWSRLVEIPIATESASTPQKTGQEPARAKPASTSSRPSAASLAPKPTQDPIASGAVLLNPALPHDAQMIQTRLSKLGLYKAAIDGIWGKGSRAALRTFKLNSSLANPDKWDKETQMLLFK
jgi:hypothetical protein